MTAATTRLGCLHMHHSNIPYIDGIVAPDRVELLLFVDPGLMRRIGSDPSFSTDRAEKQVRRQLEWMAGCGLDVILITCRNYIAMLPDVPLDLAIPVIKIDEPFFADLLKQPSPHLLLFTNPATVEGTMRRFHDYAYRAGHKPQVETDVMPGTFELVMAGDGRQLRELVQSGRYNAISVGQLSMAESALRVTAETRVPIVNPLDSLRLHLADEFGTTAAAT
jgi:hypothetical protein